MPLPALDVCGLPSSPDPCRGGPPCRGWPAGWRATDAPSTPRRRHPAFTAHPTCSPRDREPPGSGWVRATCAVLTVERESTTAATIPRRIDMFNLRNRSFLKEIDFEPRELRFLLQLVRGAEDRQVRRHRGQAARGQGDRADLREDVDAHAVGVRGRGVRSGRPRDVPRSVRLAARPQGVGGRHGAGARPDVRRDRVPRQRADRRRGARRATPACPSTTA